MKEPLQAIYANRFGGAEESRRQVWRVLTSRFFDRWVRPEHTVLDLGAGYCEFINQVQASKKYALDANPVTRERAAPDVTVLAQDVLEPWKLPSGSVDVVFTSNFLEHLPDKNALRRCFAEIHGVLRPGGALIALGPNIRFCPDLYWDFFDHYLPLSDRSLAEGLRTSGFEIERVIPRFLPFTMKDRRAPYLPALLRAYLALPFVWPAVGKQFLVIARKPS